MPDWWHPVIENRRSIPLGDGRIRASPQFSRSPADGHMTDSPCGANSQRFLRLVKLIVLALLVTLPLLSGAFGTDHPNRSVAAAAHCAQNSHTNLVGPVPSPAGSTDLPLAPCHQHHEPSLAFPTLLASRLAAVGHLFHSVISNPLLAVDHAPAAPPPRGASR